MITPSVEKIIQVMTSKGYRVYENDAVEWNLNIVGIRNISLIPDKFDDTLIVFHKFLNHWYIDYYPITTDPSVYYLQNPLPGVALTGTAILMEGQYSGRYCISKHKDIYYALCQNLGPVSVFRDNNRDGQLNINPATIQQGYFGINIHKGPKNGNWDTKNTNYSAGCQVFADSRHFNEFMQKCRNGESSFGNKFTYTLLNERDFLP